MESNIAGLYDLDKVLGKGHYGIVRLAKHVFSGQEVAVKVIDKTKLDQRETEHLLKEVQCMKLVRHPNVVRLYHVITTKSKLYLVLELGTGGDLLDYLNKMPHGIGEERTKDYFCQIIRAIAYCHHLHIVHRDLKPENIIFNEDYSVLKLTDFGFSNEFCPGEKLMTYCGSWKYSAPEILLQEEYDPPAVDVWSLGVMLFQMVAGRLPFSEVNESETLTKIMDGSYDMPDEISSLLKDLLSRMIVVEPKTRITVDEIVSHPWCSSAKKGGPINGLVHEVGITPEEHERVAKILSDNKIATRDLLKRSLDANSYDYISATYLLLAEQLKQKRVKDLGHEILPTAAAVTVPDMKHHIDHRRGSVPEVSVDLLKDIRTRRWKGREADSSCTTSTLIVHKAAPAAPAKREPAPPPVSNKEPPVLPQPPARVRETAVTANVRDHPAAPLARPREQPAAPGPQSSPGSWRSKPHFRGGSSRTSGSSGSEEDPSKSPTLGGERYLRDDDTFFTGKLKASPKRSSRRPIAALNIHAVSSSEEESEDEETPTVNHPIFDIPPRSKTLTRLFRRPTPPSNSLVNIEEEADPTEDVLCASKSQPSTLKKKRPLTVTNSLESVSSTKYAEEACDMVSPLSTPLTIQRKRETQQGSNHSSFSSSVELSSDDSDMDLGKRKKLVGLSKRDRSNIAGRKSSHGGSNMLTLVQEKLRHLEANYHEKENNVTSPSGVLPNIAEYTHSSDSSYTGSTLYPEYTGSTLHSEYSGCALHSEYTGSTLHSEYSGCALHSEYTGSTLHSEYTHNVKYIRHPVPVTWTIEDIERGHNDTSESNGEVKYDNSNKNISQQHHLNDNSNKNNKNNNNTTTSAKKLHHFLDNTPQTALLRRQLSEEGLPIEIFGRVKSTVCSVM